MKREIAGMLIAVFVGVVLLSCLVHLVVKQLEPTVNEIEHKGLKSIFSEIWNGEQ